MLSLLNSELFRLVKRPMPWIMLLILAIGVALLYGALWAVLETASNANDADGLSGNLRIGATTGLGLGLVSTLATILVIIIASSMIGAEYGWGTIRTLLPRASGRMPLAIAKLVTIGLFVTILVAFGYLVSLAMSALVTSAAGLNDDLGDGFVVHSLASVGRVIYTTVPYAALSFMVALWSRSNAAGISVGLAIYLLEDLVLAIIGLAGDAVDWLPDLLLSDNVSAILALNNVEEAGFGGVNPAGGPDPWQAAGTLALWTALFLAIALVIFHRRDVTNE
ncbi:MAG TPA: ABC transporter permease subunit [Thermomicrobiales bacterium]|nr:ABC transporter permease subunit [Thermomicrobiales bacterium]